MDKPIQTWTLPAPQGRWSRDGLHLSRPAFSWLHGPRAWRPAPLPGAQCVPQQPALAQPAGRSWPWVGVFPSLHFRQKRLGLAESFFQGRFTPKGSRPSAGPHPHPILGDLLQIHQPGCQHMPQQFRQQAVQGFGMLHPKIAQGMVVHAHPAAQPDITQIHDTPLTQLPGAADPLRSSINPQGQHYLRVRGRASGAGCANPRPRRAGRPIQQGHRLANQTSQVVGGQPRIQAGRALQLCAAHSANANLQQRGRK